MSTHEPKFERGESADVRMTSGLNFLQLAESREVPRGDAKAATAGGDVRKMLDGFAIAEAPQSVAMRIAPTDFSSRAPLHLSVNITPVHADAARDCLTAVPNAQLEEFRRAGWKIVAVKNVAEYDKLMHVNSANAHPVGYPAGMTWKNVDVITDLDHKRIVLNEYYTDFNSKREVPSLAVPQRFRHEFGHALDAIRKQKLQDDPELKRLYDADVKKLNAVDRAQLWYYLQAGDGGRRETIAGLYAIMHGGGTDSPAVENKLKSAFPDVMAYMKKRGF